MNSKAYRVSIDVSKILALIGVIASILLKPAEPPTVVTPPPVVAPADPPAIPPVLPQPPVVPAVPAPAVPDTALVIVTDSTGKRISDPKIEELAKSLASGSWTVVAVPKAEGKWRTRTLAASEWGDVGPTVTPATPVTTPTTPTTPVTPTTPSTPVTVKPTAATYVFEKNDTGVPAGVRSALNTLNRRGIIATEFEDDTTNKNSQIPSQYKVPLEKAREVGLPALIVTGDGKVLNFVKDPRTEQQVLEAIAL